MMRLKNLFLAILMVGCATVGVCSCSTNDDDVTEETSSIGDVKVGISYKCKNYNAKSNKMDCVVTVTVTGCKASDVKGYETSTQWEGNSFWGTSTQSGNTLSISKTLTGTVNKKVSFKVKVTLTNGSSKTESKKITIK